MKRTTANKYITDNYQAHLTASGRGDTGRLVAALLTLSESILVGCLYVGSKMDSRRTASNPKRK